MASAPFSFNALFLRLPLLFVEIQLLLHISSSIDSGFSVDIIHRDSPESPLYDRSSTPFSRLHAAVNRSAFRVNNLRRARFSDFIAPPPGPLRDGLSNVLYNYNFDFLSKFYIGSENKTAFLGIDTSSDFMWVLCKPCTDCYEHIPTIFDPVSSKSYKKLDCGIQPCTLHPETKCDGENKCEFVNHYLDNSFVEGILSTETIGFDFVDSSRIFNIPDINFGCIHKAKGNFDKGGIGLVGLNRGFPSLMSQLGPIIGRMFSYCLPRKNNHQSKLYFGPAAIVSGKRVLATPLLTGIDNNYYLRLDAIKVGDDEPIIVNPPQNKLHGNIMIDTGTVLTYIERMQDVLEKVKKHTPLKLKFAEHYHLCFNIHKVKKYKVPKITFIFADNADFVLHDNNAFAKIDHTTLCLLIVSSSRMGGNQIFGNLAQTGYRIGYDIDNSVLNFRRDKYCSTKYFHA